MVVGLPQDPMLFDSVTIRSNFPFLLTIISLSCSPQHHKKKNFVDELRKAVNPQYYRPTLSEGAVVACIRMCKASTYVKSAESSNVLFTLVKSVVLDLKV